MKIVLIVAILIICILLAVMVYLKYYYSWLFYKDMSFVCKELKNHIAFSKEGLSKLLSLCFSDVHFITKQMYTKDKKVKFFNFNRESVHLDRFINSLGQGDVDFELSNITYYENVFDRCVEGCEDKLNKEGKLYPKLIVSIGIVVCILLL